MVLYDIGSSYQTNRAAVVAEIVRLIIADLKFFNKELKILWSYAEEIFNTSEIELSDKMLHSYYDFRITFCLFLKMYKFLTKQKFTFLRKKCITCNAAVRALCLLVYLTDYGDMHH